jgi:hypothetical protein
LSINDWITGYLAAILFRIGFNKSQESPFLHDEIMRWLRSMQVHTAVTETLYSQERWEWLQLRAFS